METFGGQLEAGAVGPGGERWVRVRRRGALGPSPETGTVAFSAKTSSSLPAPGGPGRGEESGAAPPRGGAEAGPERTGRGGLGTRGGAGPHTGRGCWLGPLRSQRWLEEEARRLRRRGGGGGRGWSAARRKFTSPAQQGKVPRARSPTPGCRPRWGAGWGCGCGRRGRVRGPKRSRGLAGPGLRQPARLSGGRARVPNVPGGGEGGGCRASSSRRGQRWWSRVAVEPGGCGTGAGVAWGWAGGTRGLSAEGAPGAPGGRVSWAQTKPGADAPRRLRRSLGREEKALGDMGSPGQGGEQLSPKGQLGAHGLRWGWQDLGSERVGCVECSIWGKGSE